MISKTTKEISRAAGTFRIVWTDRGTVAQKWFNGSGKFVESHWENVPTSQILRVEPMDFWRGVAESANMSLAFTDVPTNSPNVGDS